MSMTDPVADFLTRIRNALIAKHDRVKLPASKLKISLSQILQDQGYVESFEVVENPPGRDIEILLRYDRRGVPAISRLARVSKPGRRVFRRADEMRPVLNGMGIGIISTSQGLLTDQEARERRGGGEVLCEIY